MDRQFVYWVIGSVRRLESEPASRAPSGVVYGDAPLEYELNLFSRRNLRCDLRRNDDLTIGREFTPEASGLHFSSLTSHIVSRGGTMGVRTAFVIARGSFRVARKN
jgi:hypothetical protein